METRSRGTAEVLDVYADGALARCRVTAGRLKLGAMVRIMRRGKIVARGLVKVLSIDREAVESAEAGQTCSLTISAVTFQPGDVIEGTR